MELLPSRPAATIWFPSGEALMALSGFFSLSMFCHSGSNFRPAASDGLENKDSVTSNSVNPSFLLGSCSSKNCSTQKLSCWKTPWMFGEQYALVDFWTQSRRLLNMTLWSMDALLDKTSMETNTMKIMSINMACIVGLNILRMTMMPLKVFYLYLFYVSIVLLTDSFFSFLLQ